MYALEPTQLRQLSALEEIACHPKFDFAIAKIDTPPIRFPLLYSGENLYVGDEIMVFSYFNAGGSALGYSANFQGRLFKGHIASLFSQPVNGRSPSTCEISFPSIAGFSGAPLLSSRDCILGMLYGNHESNIELYRYEEIGSNAHRSSESIHRVVEFGLAHTAMDIRRFLNDLGVKDIPDGPTEAALNTSLF